MKTVTMKGRTLKIVRRRTQAAFRDLYHEKLDEISSNAWRQRVPGMERDDVEAEMSYCLWVAFRTHDKSKGTDFGVYWWSIWLNHRADWIRMYNRQKRAAQELPFTHEDLMAMCPVVYPGQFLEPPPDVTSDEAHVAWTLLALGYQPAEVKATLHLNNHRYYAIVQSWQTEDVYNWLTNQY